MKKLILPCFLAFSIVASAQFTSQQNVNFAKDILREINIALLIESLPDTYAGEDEEIELDFELSTYLPTTFDSYSGMIIDESAYLIEEEIPFDFTIEAYLPIDFDPYKGMLLEEVIIEEEIPFSFNIQDYLPSGFNPNKTSGTSQF